LWVIKTAASFLVFSRPTTKIALNNDSDKVRIIFPDGKVKEEVAYEKAPEGQSSIKTTNGWSWTLTPTPGSANILTSQSSPTKKTTPEDFKASIYEVKNLETPKESSDKTKENSQKTENPINSDINKSSLQNSPQQNLDSQNIKVQATIGEAVNSLSKISIIFIAIGISFLGTLAILALKIKSKNRT